MKNKYHFSALEKQVLNDIESHGGKVYLVGGIVRDMLIFNKVDYHDVDVEIYNLEIEELQEILSKYGYVNAVGKSFGILKLDVMPNFDFALPRIEQNTGNTHRDFNVIVDKNLSLKQAAKRRDITINAIMYEYSSVKLLDFYNGLDDLNHQTIRMVNQDTFNEDPLRILRVAQFSARFDFKIDHKTQKQCALMVQNKMLSALSNERIFNEYNKLLMANKPSIGIKFLLDIQALDKPLMDLVNCNQRLDYHPEGNVMNHTLLVIDLAALVKNRTSNPLGFMWGALLHDIGKPEVTTPEGHAPGHNESGVRVFEQYYRSLINDKKLKKYIKTVIYYHMHLMNMMRNHSKDYSYYKLLKGIDGIMTIDDLVLISKCDKLGRLTNSPDGVKQLDGYVKDLKNRLGSQALVPLVNGEDLINLKVPSGKLFKELLDWAYDLQMRGHDKDDIIQLIKVRVKNGT